MTQSNAKKQNFMHGAAILTVGVLIMKILGAIYKIPLGNILGDYGYGIFLATYNVYNIFFTLSTAGLPVALSRLIAEADANGRVRQEEKTFRTAIGTFAVIGLLFSLIMFFGNDWLAAQYLHKPEAALSVRAMAPAILLVCLVSAYRGYCQGNGNMIPTTIDEVLEVLFKVISGLIIAYAVVRIGGELPKASAGAILGVSVGSVVSLGYMIWYKRKNYASLAAAYTAGIHDPNDVPDDDLLVDSTGKIVKDILRIGIPISLGASIMAILSSLDPNIYQSRLEAAGYTAYESGVLYGVCAKMQTFFNLPAAFMTPLTVAIVPAIAGALAKGNRSEARKTSEDAMRMASVISMPMGIGLCVLAFPIVQVLLPNSHEAGPGLLHIMGIGSIFVCMVLMENAILQASGKERLAMYALITGSLVKILVNYILIAIPAINIYGAPVGTMCGYVTMASLDYIFIRKALKLDMHVLTSLGKPLCCSLMMGGAAFVCYSGAAMVIGTGSKLGLLVCMAAGMLAAVAVYLVAVIGLRAITVEDMKLIPGGEKLAKLLHVKHAEEKTGTLWKKSEPVRGKHEKRG